jgi:hypothetical protein
MVTQEAIHQSLLSDGSMVITVAAMTQIQNVFVTPSGQKSSAVSI